LGRLGGRLEGHPHRFVLVHALLDVKKANGEIKEAHTRNAPPLLRIDLGRVLDALPTLLSKEA
jgi:hypothetical protein